MYKKILSISFVIVLCAVMVSSTGMSSQVSAVKSNHPKFHTPKIVGNVTVGDFPQSVAVDEKSNKIHVANDEGGTISIMDGNTDKVIKTVPVGSGQGSEPNYLAVDDNPNKIYVANAGDGTISVLDGKTDKVKGSPIVVGTPALPLGCVNNCTSMGSDSYSIVLNHKTNKIYVGNFEDSTVVVVDAKTKKVIGSPIPVGDVPYILAVNEKTNKVYVANYYDATVQVIDGNADQIVKTIPVGSPSTPDECYETGTCTDWGSLPTSVTVNEKTNKIYVTNMLGGTVVVIDGITDIVGSSIPVGVGIFFGAMDEKTNTLYVVNQFESNLSVLDGKTNKITDNIPVGTGFTPHGCNVFAGECIGYGSASTGVAVNEKTGKIYVSNGATNNVIVLDSKTHKKMSEVHMG